MSVVHNTVARLHSAARPSLIPMRSPARPWTLTLPSSLWPQAAETAPARDSLGTPKLTGSGDVVDNFE